MDTTSCEMCHDFGYLNYNVHCECPRGVFYEAKDELNLQHLYSEFDTSEFNTPYSFSDEDISSEDDNKEYSRMYLFSKLPFYDNTEHTVDIEYDDYNEYYNMRISSPWISDYEWDLHEDGDCGFLCDACVYEDSTW